MPAHIKPIVKGNFLKYHAFNSLRINLNQQCNQFKQDCEDNLQASKQGYMK